MNEKNLTVIQKFMQYIKSTDIESFVKGILFCFGAPTIKGIKSSCLINIRRDENDIKSLWKLCADKWLEPLGVEWILLNEFNEAKNALVMIYRRELLASVLVCNGACELLEAHGYPLPDVDACLKCLKGKFCSDKIRMPHEIGIFLNYPPEDVRGFIENRNAKNLSVSSYWKVYSNVKKARKTFKKYKRAEYDAALLMLKDS